MKAAILNQSSKPLIIADIDIPSKLEFGQVLVRVCYSGICGAQINEIDAVKGPDRFLPHLLGHEGSGIIEEIGPGVSTVKKNDHVKKIQEYADIYSLMGYRNIKTKLIYIKNYIVDEQ